MNKFTPNNVNRYVSKENIKSAYETLVTFATLLTIL